MAGIPGLIMGIGFRAIGGKVLGSAASGVKGVGKWLGSLDLAHFLLLVLALFGGWQTVGRWVQHRHTAKVEAQLYATTVQLTATRKDLATSQANETALKKAIADQNAAISDLSSNSAKQQKQAQVAAMAAAERAREAQASADALRRSAGQRPASGAPCEPSDTLKRQWK